MTNDNYIVIQGYMVNELHLNGNELLLYALINGFSQDGESEFHGSLNYIGSWLNISKQTTINTLKKLSEKGLIEKGEQNGWVVKKLDFGSQKSLPQGSQNSLPSSQNFRPNNNIYNNILDNNKENKERYREKVKEVLDYLNEKADKNFHLTDSNARHIIARLNEGFEVADFKKVIDLKSVSWNNEKMKPYLRPETLFGTKFDGYLNETPLPPKSNYEIIGD